MRILLLILKIVLGAAGGLIGLVLLLSCFRVRVEAELRGEKKTLKLRYLFLRLDLLRMMEKQKKTPPAGKKPVPEAAVPGETGTEKETAGAPPERPASAAPEEAPLPPAEPSPYAGPPKPGVRETWEKIRPYLDPGSRALTFIARHTHVDGFHLQVNSSSRDAAMAGIGAGAAWAFIGSVTSLLNELFGGNITYGTVDVPVCFTKEMEQEEFIGATVGLRPAVLLGAGILFLSGWLKNKRKSKRTK